MSWFNRLFGTDSSEPGVASVRSVKFDTTGLRVESRSPDRIEWRTLWGEPIVGTLTHQAAGASVPTLDIDDLRANYRADAMARGGGLVSAEIVCAGGAPAVSVVMKFREGLAGVYEGTLVVPLREARFSLARSAREQGVTGARDAAITAYLLQRGVITLPTGPSSEGPRQLEGYALDPYDPAFDGRTLCSVADDERFDELFPDDPLTVIRGWLKQVAATFSIDERVRPDSVSVAPTAMPATRLTDRVPVSAIGMLYFMFRKVEAAEAWLSRAVPTTDGEPDASDAATAETLVPLGLAREFLGQYAAADWALTRAYRMYRAAVGDDDLRTVRVMSSMARVWVLLNRHAEARPLLQDALAALARHGTNSEVAVTANDLGLAEHAAGNDRRAIELFEEALVRFEQAEKETGQVIPDRATVLNNLANALEASGVHHQAAAARARAKKLLQR